MYKHLPVFIYPFLIILCFSVYSEENWIKEFTKEGITVYTRPVEGSFLKEFKGEGMIDAPLEVCMNVMNDVENHTKWRPDCIEAKLLKQVGNIAINYSVTKAPWPVSDRDIVIRTIITSTDKKAVYDLSAIEGEDLAPLRKGVIRIKKMTGVWIFVRNGNRTHATFQAKLDPGGSIPTWLANKTSIDQPFESIKGFREMVKDPKYAEG
jgi:hypothetical protein